MKINYLPHVDGIRALSILLVLFFHAGFKLVSGGYVGVDAFFVISGFLITSLIAKDIQTGDFSFKQFYIRRIKRLMPVYVFIVIATFPLFLLILLPGDLIYHTRLIVLGLLSLSNFYIANTTDGYFETDTTEVPLVHTWSLAVEEQYYLIWPLLVILLFRISRHWMKILGLVFLVIISVVFSEWWASVDPIRAYYLLPARFFELLIGGLLALSYTHMPSVGQRWSSVISLFGLAMVITPAFVLTDESRFPGFNALPVCIGTALLIYGGMTLNPISQLLTAKPLVMLGKLSYSMYLWHWPIFSFLVYSHGELSTIAAWGAIGVTIVLSYFSWRFIENPFRFSVKTTGKEVITWFYVLPLLLMITITLVTDRGDGFIERFDEQKQIVEALESRPIMPELDCQDIKPGELCGDVFLFGDSHAEHFSNFLEVIAKSQALSLDVRKKDSCTPALGVTPVHIKDGNNFTKDDCRGFIAEMYARASSFRYVVLAGYWSSPRIKASKIYYTDDQYTLLDINSSEQAFRSGMIRGVQAIVDAGATPVIIRDNPTFLKKSLRCVKKELFQVHEDSCEESGAIIAKQREFSDPIFAELSALFPQIIFIDPSLIICTGQHCSAKIGGLPLYKDSDHLNRLGAIELGKIYLKRFGSPFISTNNSVFMKEG